MPIASRLLNRLTVIYATLTDQGWHYILMEMERAKGNVRARARQEGAAPAETGKKKRKTPAALILGGTGIVSKEYPRDDPAIRRITSQPDEFMFALEDIPQGQRLTFMRRRQYDEAVSGLSASKIPVVEVRIDPKGDPETEALAAAEEFFNGTLALGRLLKRSPANNILFSLITARLLLPVLGVVLAALLGNFFIEQHLRKQAQEQQFLIGGLHRSAAARDKEQGERQQFQNLLLPLPRYPYARIADRIASVLPEGVILTELSVQPVLKKLQENKPVETERDRVLIRGESASAAPVTLLTDTLGKIDIRRSVQLLSLTRDRNNRYQFEIDLRL